MLIVDKKEPRIVGRREVSSKKRRYVGTKRGNRAYDIL